MMHARQAKPQVFKSSTSLSVLNLKLDDSDLDDTTKVPNSTSSSRGAATKSGGGESSGKMPLSFQGFDVKTDVEIRKQAKKSWFDLDDDSSAATTPFGGGPSPFENINVPAFPPATEDSAAEGGAAATAAAAEEEEEEEEQRHEETPSAATPTRDEESRLMEVAEAPLKHGEQDADGAESFEEPKQQQQQQQPQSQQPQSQQPRGQQLPTYNQRPAAPQYNANVYQQYPQQQAPRPSPYQQKQPTQGAFRSHLQQPQYPQPHQPQQQQQFQPQPPAFQQMPPHPVPQQQQQQPRPSSDKSGSSDPSTSPTAAALEEEPTTDPTAISVPRDLAQRPANHELIGFLPFYKFDNLALGAELPSADALGAMPQRHPKVFLGHVWSKVPTGVVQWLLKSFGPSGATAFGAQLHYNREGWFRGCLHCSVATEDPQALIYALHKRVLFDHEGVWFAESADQMRVLDDYCRRLRALPQQIRHTKLQSLPCNPLACELARNE